MAANGCNGSGGGGGSGVFRGRLLAKDGRQITWSCSTRDAKSGKVLWHLNTGGLITASPMTYSVEGKQYVAVASYSNVIAFGLP